jgi:cysteine desulfurase
MTRETSYLDYNASAPIRPAARDAVVDALSTCGNPSSVHAEGRKARQLVEGARRAVADVLGRPMEQVVLTSGGTEADAMALIATPPGPRIISAIEHEAVLAATSLADPDATRITVDPNGRVRLEDLERALAGLPDGPAPLVSIMWVNNETGVLQPIEDIARLAHAAGARLHVDAVQGLGRCDPAELSGADLITLSAHKIGGPKGIGCLVVPEGMPLRPLVPGGGQEKGRRSGTENVAAAAGLGAAVREIGATWRDEVARLAVLRDRMEAAILRTAPEARIMGAGAARVSNTSNIALPGVPAETQVMTLDLVGVMVSAGSACSSGKVKASHVLAAMLPDDPIAGHAIRVSLGWETTDADIDRFLEAWRAMRDRLSPAARAA